MKVSVALCTYNGQEYIRKQLDSILNQTRKVDEICIFDDCSTDNTYKILQQYQQQYPAIIKIKQNPKNLRVVQNFICAISACSGDIVFLSDHDDLWLPTKVEEYLDYFDKHTHLNVLCSNGFLIDENDQIIDAITVWDVPAILKEKNGHINYLDCITLRGNIATGASMAIQKTFIKEILSVPLIEEIILHDEWIALLASAKNGFEIMDKKLFCYRLHSEQQVGIVPYPDNIESRQILYEEYAPLKADTFAELKIALKHVAFKYNRYVTMRKNSPLISDILRTIEEKYRELQKDLVARYPIRGRLTLLTDKITKKRQLVN